MALLLAFLAGVLLLASPVGAAAAEDPPQLRQDGRWLVDHHNRVVLLHGVNAIWKRAPYCPPDDPTGFTRADARWLADNGFNVVRTGVIFAGVMPEAGRIDAAYLDCVDRVVDLLAGEGIWVLLDSHQDLYAEVFGGEGFPPWAVHTDGIPPPADATDMGFPGNYLHPSTSRAFDNLYADRDDLHARFAEGWQAAARRWQDQPYLAGYEILNEPWPGSQYPTCAQPEGCPAFDVGSLRPFYERIHAGIREVDERNLVWVKPHTLGSFGIRSWIGLEGPIGPGPNGFGWNAYCLTAGDGGTSPECETVEDHAFGISAEEAARLEAASLVTEFGAADNPDETGRVARLADDHLSGWVYWTYKDWEDPTNSGESGAMFEDDTDLGSVKLDKLRLLSRTYPQATAGTPRELSFDPSTGEFRFVFTAAEATAPTEIFVPVDLHYPHGYDVTVTGGEAVGAPRSTTLVVESDAGGGDVTVELRPRPAEGDGGPAAPPDGTARPVEGDGRDEPTPATGGGAALASVASLAVAVLLTRRRS